MNDTPDFNLKNLIRPTEQQHRAADPARSVWVTASAGTGKTRVLTNRVLRLLMAGAAPESILCLTYTKAAASEMTSRITHDLAKWAGEARDEVLAAQLDALTGSTPTHDDLARARRLFDDVLASSEGMRIQTIHSLSESLLRRFPLEADVPVHFDVIDDQQAMELRKDTLREFLQHPPDHLKPLLQQTALLMNEAELRNVMELDARHGDWISTMSESVDSSQKAFSALAKALGYPEMMSPDFHPGSILDGMPDDATLRHWQEVLRQFPKNKTAAKNIAFWEDWLNLSAEQRNARIEDYTKIFLTKKGTRNTRLVFKDLEKISPDIADALNNEADRLVEFGQRAIVASNFAYNRAVLPVIAALHKAYADTKFRLGLLDFDDQIEKARFLLHDAAEADWIRYRLDASFDHILVDEAQDTSKAQWQIIEALASDFFEHEPETGKLHRTLFVVGDEKQSIYSFQGANRDVFTDMLETFQARAAERNVPFDLVTLNESFRTTESILTFVDATFASDEAAKGVSYGDAPTSHISNRTGEFSRVAIWPIPGYRTPNKPTFDEMLDDRPSGTSDMSDDKATLQPAARAAEAVAAWIDASIRKQTVLPSTNRPITPGDVLILMPRRGKLQTLLVDACRARGLPTAGLDRLKLQDSLVVKDLVALGEACLLPQDDLNLAILLKSPVFGFDDDDLFRICHGRGKQTVFSRLQQEAEAGNAPFAEAYEQFSHYLQLADFYPPYDFFTEMLGHGGLRKKLVARLGYAVDDVIEVFLTQCMNYEMGRVPTMQGFLHWIKSDDSELTRDPEEAGNVIRLMTVHGSKGLEAPVVFVMDTAYKPKSNKDSLQFLENSTLPLWKFDSEGLKTVPAIKEALERDELLQWEERKRLLYVALTRARDELHIVGWPIRPTKDGGLSETFLEGDQWHSLISAGAGMMQQQVSLFEETNLGPVAKDGRQFSLGARPDAIEAVRHAVSTGAALPTPRDHAPEEPLVLPSIAPSSLSEDMTYVAESPANAAGRADALRRGTVIHELLRYLPDTAQAQREAFALKWLKAKLPEDQQSDADSLARRLTALIAREDLADLFASGSRAEVSLMGEMSIRGAMRVVEGVVDRIRITETDICFADYKTDRHVPTDLADIPERYDQQMQAYATILRKAYPDHRISMALVYCEDGTVHWLN